MAVPTSQGIASDKHFDDIVGQSQNFEHYEKIFQEVIMDLENDETLEVFRQEYDQLHNSFLKCHEGEKRLIKKCQDLWAEISSCVLKVKAAEELSQGDKNTVDQLKKEIAKAKSKIEQSKETEVTLKEKIKQLKIDIRELDEQLKKGPSNVAGNTQELQDLDNIKHGLQKDSEAQQQQLLAITHDITHMQNRVAKAQADRAAQMAELQSLRTAISEKNHELEDQRLRKDRREKDLGDLKKGLTDASQEVGDNQATIQQLVQENKQYEEKVAATRELMEQASKDLSVIQRTTHRSQQDLDDLSRHNEQLAKELTALSQEIKQKDSELAAATREVQKQQKIVEGIDRRNVAVETERAEAEARRDHTHTEQQQMELAIAALGKQAENDRKQLEDLKRERDILNKSYLKAQSATQRQKDWLTVKESQRRNLDHQVRGYERHGQKQRELIHQLAKEARGYEEEAEVAASKYGRTLDEVKQEEQASVQRQKDIQDVEAKLRQQQTMLDTVLNERNLYAKNALRLQQEINDMTRKFRGMQTLIDSLKTEIKVKDIELLKEETKVADLIKEKGTHELRIDSCKKITEKRERTIDAYNDELHKLNQIIAEADSEKGKQRRDHLNVMNERDILGAQLIRRNDELAQLYEQIRVQQSTLRQGEAQYGQRLKDVQQLSFRVQQLRGELGGMKAFASRLPELKLLINKATRELHREQCRVRQLLDDCDNPRNVHRFRRMEGSEPQTRQLFKRVKELQDELLAKTSEVAQKDRLIAEKEKLYVELKAVLSRQPGPEVAEQLNVYQDSMQKKTGQLAAMRESLSQFELQVENNKARHAELQTELRDLGNAYRTQRKRLDKDQDRQRVINEMLGRQADAPLDAQEEVYTGYTAPPRPATPSEAGGPRPIPDESPPPADADERPLPHDAPAPVPEEEEDIPPHDDEATYDAPELRDPPEDIDVADVADEAADDTDVPPE